MQISYLLVLASSAVATTFYESITETETITSCAPGVTDCPASHGTIVPTHPAGNSTIIPPPPSGNGTQPPTPTYIAAANSLNVGAGVAVAAGLGALLI